MPPKLFGFHRSTIGAPRYAVGHGGVPIELEPPLLPAAPAPAAKIFAVSVPMKGGLPHVFEYPDNDDGRAELANLARGERVITAVIGHRIDVEVAHVVEIVSNGLRIVDRHPHN